MTIAANNHNRQPEEFSYFFLSQLLGVRVRFADSKKPWGRLRDLGASSRGGYPLVTCLKAQTSEGTRYVPWTAVAECSMRGIVLKREALTGLDLAAAPAVNFWARDDVLDDQVVDLSGAKVVRVNDVHMLMAQGQLVLGHVDVGTRGILRRLGVERAVCNLLDWLLDYKLPERFVTWRHVEVIPAGNTAGGLKVSAGPSRLEEIHPAELADILEQLGVEERHTIFNALPVETAAETFEELDPEAQRTFIAQAEPAKAAGLLEEMPATEAAAVLRDFQNGDAQRIISRMESEAAADVQTILAHHEETAGGAMATDCIEAKAEETVATVLERVRQLANEAEVFNHIYALDAERRLIGVLNLRELLSAPPTETIASLMTTDIIKVSPQTTLHDTARLLLKYGFRAVPVVDENNVFLGAVRIMRVVDELLPAFKE